MVKVTKVLRGFGVVAGALGLFAAGIIVPTNAHAQTVKRLAANFLNFDGTEVDADGALNTTINPVPIYAKSGKVPGNINTLYVTITATGDAHNGAQILIQCLVDGLPCNAGIGNNTAPSGFVVVQEHAGRIHDDFGEFITFFGQFEGAIDGDNGEDFHDNTVHYTWCVPIAKGRRTHSAALNLATSGPGDGTTAGGGNGDVFLEQIHVFVDGSKLGKGDGCTAMANP